jgi:transcriptional regulator with XRE-family HTH domain
MLSTSCENIGTMHEGKKIEALLKRAGKTQSDLARAASVTPTAVGRYMAAEELGAKAWESAARGLARLGLDPSEIRAVAATMMRERPEVELRQLLNAFSAKQMEALRQILDAPADAQRVLRAIIDDRLERH